MNPRWLGLSLTAVALIVAKLRSRPSYAVSSSTAGPTDWPGATPDADDPEPGEDGPVAPGPSGVRRPIAVGRRDEPAIAALLSEMEVFFRSEGVDTKLVSPYEVTVMPKTKTSAAAIPPRDLWPRMAKTLREVVMPLRMQLGIPFTVRGYRPADYNKAVGGAPGSRHMHFEAADVYLAGSGNTSENRRKLALAAARLFQDRGHELRMGFGAYGYPTPSNIHVDTGYQRRTWEKAQRYLDDLRRTS